MTGPSSELNNAIASPHSVEGQTEVLWKDPGNRGWKSKVPYRFFLEHRPIIGSIHLKIYEGSVELFDTTITDHGLSGGRVGVFCYSQEKEIWSSMSYQCKQE